MLTVKIMPDSRMRITATGPERKDFQAGLKIDQQNQNSLMDLRMENEVLHYLSDCGYDSIQPEEVGTLTSAPMVCDDSENPTQVWAFMDYAVTSIPTQLAERGYAILEHSTLEG